MSQIGHALVFRREVGTGRRIRTARVAAGLRPTQMASALGISRRTYDRLEDGSRHPRAGELAKIAELTGQDVEVFGASSDEGAGS